MAIKLKQTWLLGIAFVSIVWILYLLFWPRRIDGFEMNTSYPKTIYLIWRNMSPIPGNDATHAGFGDKVRGAIALYQYCRTNKINLKIDIRQDTSHHVLRLQSAEPKYEKNELLDIGGNLTHLTNKLNDLLADKTTIYCGCSGYPAGLTEEDKSFAKHLLELTPEFQKEVDAIVGGLPTGYGIKHYRFKDDIFDKDGLDMTNETFALCFNHLKKTYKETDVLMTNSSSFKKYAIEQLKIKTIECDGSAEECKISHIGMNPDYKSSKFSYIEFFCVCRATYIHTYSDYGSISGFVQWPANIFDIPISQVTLR
jgi:hypothetical protein